jgi:hypothetical protein
MARGSVIGEKIVSQARTKEFDEGYDRIFGPDRQPIRGHWVWDENEGRLVSADEYRAPVHAKNAPIMAGRFYENTKATDGTDIGSRRKHKAYMKDHNLTTMDDFGGEWKRAQERRDGIKEGRMPDPKRREALERAFHEIDGKP